MSYPDSPFKKDFNTKLIFESHEGSMNDSIIQIDDKRLEILKWLCTSPKLSSYRVNTLKTSLPEVEELFKKELSKNPQFTNSSMLHKHEFLKDVILVKNAPIEKGNLKRYEKEIIVDAACAAAVLRGAHIFAPGVLGMSSGVKRNDNVSIYCDVGKTCKKGSRILEDCKKIFIGNGKAKLERHELFGKNLVTNGVGVEIFETISGCVYYNIESLPRGFVLLQNLPSILCSVILNPQPHDTVLDMCASPGNKTTHLAALMKNTGVIIAIDKTPSKLDQLKQKCEDFNATNVLCYQADSTKILTENFTFDSNYCLGSPPFPAECFDKILLDAPCSVLGKRPQFMNTITEKELKSYVPLQRKLFETAVKLLKLGGTLVYSTCTITLNENEGITCWALEKFKNLKLIKSQPYLGSPGWKGTSLSDQDRHCLQRFGPDSINMDSVGFFIACFNKIQI